MNYINQSFKQKKTVGSWNAKHHGNLVFRGKEILVETMVNTHIGFGIVEIGWFSCSYHVDVGA